MVVSISNLVVAVAAILVSDNQVQRSKQMCQRYHRDSSNAEFREHVQLRTFGVYRQYQLTR